MKLSKLEKFWVLYDVGNSAFVMLISTIIPIFFKNLASQAGVSGDMSTAYWGYASSIATVVVAFMGPILGTIGDHKDFKLPLFKTSLIIGAFGCAAMGFASHWLWFLFIFIVGKIGYSVSLVFYDSMLCDITDDSRMDTVSSHGYAWGYIGSCIPFIISLVLILTAEMTGIGTVNATVAAFILNALWWVVCSAPLIKYYKQSHFVENTQGVVKKAFSDILGTIKDINKNKKILTFLLAFFLYIDGVYTIIEMATSYGKDVGISDNSLLLALLFTQIVAFPCAILFGKIARKKDNSTVISMSIIGYLFISLFALQLDRAWEFWFLAACVAVFQGGIQALSRSYFAKIVPKENSNKYFGIYDIFGKGAAFTGTFLIGLITQITNNSSYGVLVLPVLFCLGYIMFKAHLKVKG